MKSKDILNAMGKIDGRLIDEALEAEAKNISEKSSLDLGKDEYYPESIIEVKSTRNKIGFLRWAGLAAAVSIITAGAILMSQLQRFNGIESNAASTGVNITLTANPPMTSPAETETTDDSKPSASEPAVISKPEILPNGLPDVPLAELKPFEELFSMEVIDYADTNGLTPKFIADGRIYCTDHYALQDENKVIVTFYSYDPRKDELKEIFTDEFSGSESVNYYFLCSYGDYLYFYRGIASDVTFEKSSDESNIDTADYSLCRLNTSDQTLREMADITLELTAYPESCAVFGKYMYFEEITGVDDISKKHIYNISRMNLEDCSVSTFAENARCPLIYEDKLVFYRNGAFWQSELDGGFGEQVLFYDTTIDFLKDRICSDGKNIILARCYTEYREDGNQYSAFTIEIYDRMEGFVPKALFTADVTSSDFFLNVFSAPIISCSDGLFSFLDVVFDPETDIFAQITQTDNKHFFQTVAADGKIYYCAFESDWKEEKSLRTAVYNYYMLMKKENPQP